MSKTIIYKALAIFFAVYLPVALVGVPLHKHYCEGELADMKVLFEAESCHDLKIDTHSCCSSDLTGCHSEKATSQEGNCESSDCCDDQMELLKADVTLITKNSQELKFDIANLFGPYAFSLQSALIQIATFYPFTNEPPPGPYLKGADRLIRHGQFLC